LNFILHLFVYFGISCIFLGMLHKITYLVIFSFTCILNWKVPTFSYVYFGQTPY
jgi:hypothetical protein